jgi:hypothetical protein
VAELADAADSKSAIYKIKSLIRLGFSRSATPKTAKIPALSFPNLSQLFGEAEYHGGGNY